MCLAAFRQDRAVAGEDREEQRRRRPEIRSQFYRVWVDRKRCHGRPLEWEDIVQMFQDIQCLVGVPIKPPKERRPRGPRAGEEVSTDLEPDSASPKNRVKTRKPNLLNPRPKQSRINSSTYRHRYRARRHQHTLPKASGRCAASSARSLT
jgi:hypothetical protein